MEYVVIEQFANSDEAARQRALLALLRQVENVSA